MAGLVQGGPTTISHNHSNAVQQETTHSRKVLNCDRRSSRSMVMVFALFMAHPTNLSRDHTAVSPSPTCNLLGFWVTKNLKIALFSQKMVPSQNCQGRHLGSTLSMKIGQKEVLNYFTSSDPHHDISKQPR